MAQLKIVRTTAYQRRIERLLTAAECERAENEIADDPTAWPVIKGSGGVRKARFGRDDLGKSGGGRIAYVFWEAYETIYFLAAYPHNEKDNFSKTELVAFKKLVKSLLKAKRDEAAKPERAKSR